MAINYTQLASEITTDPKGLGYAGKGPADQAALINAITGPGAGTVARLSVPIGDPAIVSLLSYALTQIRAMTSVNLQSFYLNLISTIVSVQSLTPQNTYLQTVLGQAITDGVVTPTLVGPIQSKTGSRAEVLFGEGTVVQWQEMANSIGA